MNCESSTPNPTLQSPPNHQNTPAGTPTQQTADRDTCFLCKQKGHWMKDCSLKSGAKQSKPPSPMNGGDGVPQKLCRCGEGPCHIRTSRTSTNPERKFYACPGNGPMSCRFFQWCDEDGSDEGSNSPLSPYPMCPCRAGKCRLVPIRKGENTGRMAFTCHIKKGQGACGFFQVLDSPAKEDDIIDGRSNEGVHLGNPQPVSNIDKDTEAAIKGKQVAYDTEPEYVLPAVFNENGLPSLSNSERAGFQEQMDHHQLPIGNLSLYGEREECNEGKPQKGLHIEEAEPCLPFERLDLNEEGEEGDDDGLQNLLFVGFINEGEGEDDELEIEGIFLYGSVEKESTSSSGTDFLLKVGSPPERLERRSAHGEEDGQLFWPVSKKRAPSSCKQFELEVGQRSVIRRLDFDSVSVEADCNGLGSSPCNVPKEKGKASSSVEGFQTEGRRHSNIRMSDLQEQEDDGDVGVKEVSFGGQQGKALVSTSAEELQVARTGNHPDIEMVDLHEEQRNENDKGSETHHHPEVELMDSDFEWGEEDEKALEDLILSACIRKGLVSSVGEGFQGNMGCHLQTEELNLQEERDAGDLDSAQGPPSVSGSGSDVEWIDLNEREVNDVAKGMVNKEMLSSFLVGFEGEGMSKPEANENFFVIRQDYQPPSSDKGFQSEVGCHHPCVGHNSHGEGMAAVNANRSDGDAAPAASDGMLLNSSNEKMHPALPNEGSKKSKMSHKCIVEGIGLTGGNVSNMAPPQARKLFQPVTAGNVSNMAPPQARKLFQPVTAGNMVKQFGGSQICFKCGKYGHSRKDCNS